MVGENGAITISTQILWVAHQEEFIEALWSDEMRAVNKKLRWWVMSWIWLRKAEKLSELCATKLFAGKTDEKKVEQNKKSFGDWNLGKSWWGARVSLTGCTMTHNWLWRVTDWNMKTWKEDWLPSPTPSPFSFFLSSPKESCYLMMHSMQCSLFFQVQLHLRERKWREKPIEGMERGAREMKFVEQQLVAVRKREREWEISPPSSTSNLLLIFFSSFL